jgi:hypothetical protein
MTPWARCATVAGARALRRGSVGCTSIGRVFLNVRSVQGFVERDGISSATTSAAFVYHRDIIPSTPTTPTRVHIAAAPDQTRDREQTQVIFLKRQEYRTDLFGVGAIAFDLISCGKSSERFYESIRRFEFDGNVLGSVEATIGKYRRVKDGLADEPELVHIRAVQARI